MSMNEPTSEQIQQARELLSFEDKSVRLSPIALVARLIARCERAEAKLLKPSPISYDDLIQCPEKCAEYLKLHDAIIEDDDGIRTCADGTKRQTDRRLGYSLCWPHGVMLIGHKGCYPRAEKWAALFIYFWKYHKVPCDVLDEMLGELTGIHYVMEQRDEAIATAKEAHARIGAAIARAERAEREAREAKAEVKHLAAEVTRLYALAQKHRHPDRTCSLEAQGYDPAECDRIAALDSFAGEILHPFSVEHAAIKRAAVASLTRNSAGGGLEHERGAGGGK